MLFARPLRERVRRGRITCSVRVWTRPHVKVGGHYQMEDGHIVVDAITAIEMDGVTEELARESGFATVEELLDTARHGSGQSVYLIRFHYLPPGGWEPDARRGPVAGRGSGQALGHLKVAPTKSGTSATKSGTSATKSGTSATKSGTSATKPGPSATKSGKAPAKSGKPSTDRGKSARKRGKSRM